jgi:protease-4
MEPIETIVRRITSRWHPGQTILEIDLDLGVSVGSPATPWEAFRTLQTPTMQGLIAGLRKGAADPSVVGLVLHTGTCPYSPAQLGDLALALEDFRRTKPIAAYTESFGEFSSGMLAYRLASVAQQVWLQPSGELALSGVATTATLLRGTLDKVGVEPEFSQRHEYKTAADRFSASEVTPAHREMLQRIGDSIVEDSVAMIAKRRNLTRDEVWATVNGPALGAHEAVERGFIDHIGYRDEVYRVARRQWGSDAHLQYSHRFAKSAPSRPRKSKSAVAVVPVVGSIVTGRPAPGPGGRPASCELVGQQLRRAAADDHVRAVVLRVDSPGGSYIASDAIRREVQQVQAAGKPVVASMGGVAASGGYFVAMPADEIVACPTTLTGSIGVLAGKMVVSRLKERIGLVSVDIPSGSWSTMLSSNTGFTDEQWAALDARLDAIYEDFVSKAASDRGVAPGALEAVARGRVWTGSDARVHGLVDHLGGAELAVQRACALAGLDRGEATIKALDRASLLTRITPAESSDTGVATAPVRPLASVLAAGPDALVKEVAAAAGWDAAGVLALPYRIRIR